MSDLKKLYLTYRILGARAMFRDAKHRRAAIRKFPVGSIVEDCNYHACLVLANDGEDLKLLSLHNGGIGHCSSHYCGIVLLDGDYVAQKIKAYQEAGEEGLSMLEGVGIC